MFRTSLLNLAASGRFLRSSKRVPFVNVAFQAQKFSVSSTNLASGSLFGEVTESKEVQPQTQEQPVDAANVTPENDAKLQEYYVEESKKNQIVSEKYVSPLKRRLFDLNVAQHGFFKNNHIVADAESGKKYKLSLTSEEIDMLEPTIYLQSYRIKSSMKKATVVNRFVRGSNVKNAINQLHFNPKKMSTELEKLLKRGVEQARALGYNEDGLYIQALWTGSDGNWVKRVDIKGRGRTGIIEHPYVHLKAILKTEQTKRRLQWEKDQARAEAKPRMYLNNEPLNFKVQPFYKW